MVNYILLYKIKKKVKAMIKDKLALGEIATTPNLPRLPDHPTPQQGDLLPDEGKIRNLIRSRRFLSDEQAFTQAHQSIRFRISFS